jgi:hypothetical protein
MAVIVLVNRPTPIVMKITNEVCTGDSYAWTRIFVAEMEELASKD